MDKLLKKIGYFSSPPLADRPRELRSVLQQLEGLAERELSEMSHLVRDISHSHTYEEATKIAGKVVNGVGHILDYVRVVAQLHPVADVVVNAVQKVIVLEQTRVENNAHLAQVHESMVRAVYHLKVLIPITTEDEEHDSELRTHLESTFEHMARTIKEFGAFVDFYHKCFQKIFHVLWASHHKHKLEDLHDQFDKHRAELDRVVSTRSTQKTLKQLDVLDKRTQFIVNHLPVPDPGLVDAEHFVELNGGAAKVLQDDKLLKELADKLNEKITDNMKDMLREGLNSLLEKHAEQYELKLRSVEEHVIAAMNASHAELSRQLNVGPHELIQDEDIRTIWKENGWRSGVKSRTLVEALHEYYQREFNNHNAAHGVYRRDAWTVEFFSRMMYHSAIGDIIDDDGSGWITASEMNTFCSPRGRRPGDWSIPEWFAFCASGWYNNNLWYYRSVKDMLDQIDAALKVSVNPDERWKTVQDIMGSLKQLLLVESVGEFPQNAVPPGLGRLQEEHRNQALQATTRNLEKFHYRVEDKSAVFAIMRDTRIELHIMSILYVLVTRLQHIIQMLSRHKHINLRELGSVEDLATSTMVVFLTFQSRMHDLMRGWRSQGHDIDLQLGRYADGLFRDIQRKAQPFKDALNVLCNTLFGMKTPTRYSLMIKSACREPHSQVGDMANQVTSLTERVVKLEKALVALHPGLLERLQQLSQTSNRPASPSSGNTLQAADEALANPEDPAQLDEHPAEAAQPEAAPSRQRRWSRICNFFRRAA